MKMTLNRVKNMLWQLEPLHIYHLESIVAVFNFVKLSLSAMKVLSVDNAE